MPQPETRPKRGVPRYDQLNPGWSRCYECGGDGACSICGGDGRDEGATCTNCGGNGRCIVCRGAGQLAPEKRLLEYVGMYRELGFEDSPDYPSVDDARGRRAPDHKPEVVAYLAGGKAMSPSILTDGRYAWSKQLAYYVDHYDVTLPEHFERHMAALGYRMPDVDTSKVTLG